MAAAEAPELDQADAPVVFSELATASGHVVAVARLNVPATLNSLSLSMIDLLLPALGHWAARADVVALVFAGSGDKAFCAGGDIQALYRAVRANQDAGETVDSYAFEFFEREYRLDYLIHTFPKPVLALGHGIVMGGGFGIFSGADFRLVTERSKLAFPEVTIGLFPDAGGTWVLRNMPEHLGLFFGITGSHMNAADALATGVATHSVAATLRDVLADRLAELAWQGDAAADSATLRSWLDGQHVELALTAESAAVPESLSLDGSYADVVARVQALAGQNEWIDRGVAAMNSGCPVTVGIVIEQLRRAPSLSLADCFRLEMTVGTHCATKPDFPEGVRALLIDKDGAPQWRHAAVADMPDADVLEHFQPPWPDNPLKDLGAS